MRPLSTTMKYIPSLDGERGPEVHFSFASYGLSIVSLASRQKHMRPGRNERLDGFGRQELLYVVVNIEAVFRRCPVGVHIPASPSPNESSRGGQHYRQSLWDVLLRRVPLEPPISPVLPK